LARSFGTLRLLPGLIGALGFQPSGFLLRCLRCGNARGFGLQGFLACGLLGGGFTRLFLACQFLLPCRSLPCCLGTQGLLSGGFDALRFESRRFLLQCGQTSSFLGRCLTGSLGPGRLLTLGLLPLGLLPLCFLLNGGLARRFDAHGLLAGSFLA
jgi:hypothetical protein